MLDILLQLTIFSILTGGLYALISVGLTLIFGTLQIVNFAHGEFLMLSMYFTFWLNYYFGMSPYISFFILLPVFFLIGLVIENTLMEPIIEKKFTIQICATLGLSLIIKYGALFAWGPGPRSVKSDFASKILSISGMYVRYGEVVFFLISVIIITLLFLFLYKTYPGKAIRAVAMDRKGAALLGINVRKTYLLTFGLGISCVSAAGAIMTPIYICTPTVGTTFVMLAFIIVVLGGYNSIIGTLIAAFLLSFVEMFSSYFITVHLKEAIMFGLFFVILLFKPEGLLKNR